MTDTPPTDVAVHPVVATAIAREVAPIGRAVDEVVRTVVGNGHRTAHALALMAEAHASLLDAFLDLSARVRRLEAAAGNPPAIVESPVR